MMKTMADNLILPDDEDEDEDVLYVPKAYQPAYSAPPMQERVFIRESIDHPCCAAPLIFYPLQLEPETTAGRHRARVPRARCLLDRRLVHPKPTSRSRLLSFLS